MRGGSRPGERRGGRKRGTPNKLTIERERARAEAAAKIKDVLGPDAFDGDAHTLLTLVYRNTALPIELRVDAAKAAIGFERPRLASVHNKLEGELTFSAVIERAMKAIEARRAANDPGP